MKDIKLNSNAMKKKEWRKPFIYVLNVGMTNEVGDYSDDGMGGGS